MSSGETASEPSPIEGTGCSGVCTPSFFAIRATFDRRGTVLPEGLPVALTDEFAVDATKRAQWAGFVRKSGTSTELPDFDLGIELHGEHEPPAAMEIIKALEPFRPWFYEEPIQFQNLHLMAEMAKKTTVPFATGERMVTK